MQNEDALFLEKKVILGTEKLGIVNAILFLNKVLNDKTPFIPDEYTPTIDEELWCLKHSILVLPPC
jgi:hypothetical protein